MRILHTSDWHLGRTLEGRDRSAEQEAFLLEMCDIAEKEKVDLVLISGDIFDTPNPPARAEQLFYQSLYELAAGGRRGIIAIAGNHDNPERIKAADPLAEQLGITLVGLPKDQAAIGTGSGGRVRRLEAGQGWLELAVPGCDHSAVVITLPYPSEQRLQEILAETLAEEIMQENYSERIGAIFRKLTRHYRRDTVNLCMSHLFVRGGKESESERPIQLGGSPTVDTSMLPLNHAQYIALGHLHRPQRVGGADHARYSGSPLSYSFSEAGQSKVIYLVDCLPGKTPQVREIPLSSGSPLVRWEAREGFQQVIKWCEEKRDLTAWIDLTVYIDEPLNISQVKQLKDLRPGIINIRPVFNKQMPAGFKAENRMNLPVEQLFRDFYQQNFQSEPNGELIRLFLDLLAEEKEVEAS
ncbi:MAG: metallophosphoesterase family protein [Peptococcaceae bacterium]